VASQVSALQQSASVAHAWPLVAQAPPSMLGVVQVMLLPSHVRPLQHVGIVGSHCPPFPVHAAWHFPMTQLLEQQSPFVLQQS